MRSVLTLAAALQLLALGRAEPGGVVAAATAGRDEARSNAGMEGVWRSLGRRSCEEQYLCDTL